MQDSPLKQHGVRTEKLSIKARFEEPVGGVLAEAMGFEGPLHLSLEGEGQQRRWEGSLKGRGGPFQAMESKVHLLREKDTELTFSGSFKVNRAQLPEALAAWVSEEASLTFVARPENNETVSLEQLSLQTGSIALELRGKLDLAANRSTMDFSWCPRTSLPWESFWIRYHPASSRQGERSQDRTGGQELSLIFDWKTLPRAE